MFADVLNVLIDPLYGVIVVGGLLSAALLTLAPGLSRTLLMALVLPFIVSSALPWEMGFLLIAAVAGAATLGPTSHAVLFGLPSSALYVTFLEGHQLARQGKASHTLGAMYAAAAFGSLLGALALLLLIPAARLGAHRLADKPEVWLAGTLLALILVVLVMSKAALAKGFAAAGVGVLLSTIGVADATGEARFTFGQPELEAGLPLAAAALGLFVLPEMIDLSIARRPVAPAGAVLDRREALAGAGYALRRWPMLLRQSAFGTLFNAAPGFGGGLVSWLAYGLGVGLSDKSKFGKGSLDGALFAESARHSRAPGALPTMLLGIPSSGAWTFALVALLSYGVAPGPRLLEERPDLLVLIAVTLAIGAVAVLPIGLGLAGWLGKLTRIPYPLVAGVFIPGAIFAMLASYAKYGLPPASGVPGAAPVWLVLAALALFTGAGILMKVFQWPRPPLLLGFTSGWFIDRLLSSITERGALEPGWLPVGAAVAVAVAATVASARSEWHRSRSVGNAATLSEDGDGDSLLLRLWKPRNVLVLLALVCGMVFLAGSLRLDSVWTKALPAGAALLVIALALTQLVLHLRERGERRAEILDLGMHSLAAPGAAQAAWTIAAGFVVFVLLTAAVGVDWAAVALAAYFPLALLGRAGLPLPNAAAIGVGAHGQGSAPDAPVAVGVVALTLATLACVLHLSAIPDSPQDWALRLAPVVALLLLLAPSVRRAQPSRTLEWLFTWRAQGAIIAVSVVALSIYTLEHVYAVTPPP